LRSLSGPTVIDLFSGAGGLSYGLKRAGFSVLVGADHDARAIETHTANIGSLDYQGDLSDPSPFLEQLSQWGIRSVNLIAGGIPCQPFSRAGRAKLRNLALNGVRPFQDPRTALWQPFLSIVESLSPDLVLLENVPDFALWDDGALLTQFRESLRAIGYETHVNILNAFQFRVPQHRSRLFVVALRRPRAFRWPAPFDAIPTLRDAIGDLPPVPPGQREERIPYGEPTTALQELLRQGVPPEDRHWIYDHVTRAVRPDDESAFALLREGQTYRDLPAHLQRYRDDIFLDKYNRLRYDDLCRSITAHLEKDGYWYIHPEQNRTLSVREAARIQTFPDHYRFAGEPTIRFRQIGNAVPPLLAESVARSLLDTLNSPPPRGRRLSFRQRLIRWHAADGRRFPWRQTDDPWDILLAEMLLRRTHADRVAAVYQTLVERFPHPEAVQQRADEFIALVAPLGLRWRARNIVDLASRLLEEHGGHVPDDRAALRRLPGVGDYVANAVLCFAFGKRAVLVDTNTRRVVGRVREPVAKRADLWRMRAALYDLADAPGPDAEFNYALLDLAAVVCRPAAPACDRCPVHALCDFGRRRAVSATASELSERT
jgi:DNA (cytosine-5)-methyltransferase 1